MHFIAEELREVLASLGIRTVEELVDVPTCYNAQVELMNNQKAATLDIEKLLIQMMALTQKKLIKIII